MHFAFGSTLLDFIAIPLFLGNRTLIIGLNNIILHH